MPDDVVTVGVVGNTHSTFLNVTFHYSDKQWAYSVSSKEVYDNGWSGMISSALGSIAKNAKVDVNTFRAEMTYGLHSYLTKLYPPRPKFVPMKRIAKMPIEKKPSHPTTPPPKPAPPDTNTRSMVEYTKLPMAKVYRRRTLFWEWVRKILRL